MEVTVAVGLAGFIASVASNAISTLIVVGAVFGVGKKITVAVGGAAGLSGVAPDALPAAVNAGGAIDIAVTVGVAAGGIFASARKHKG